MAPDELVIAYLPLGDPFRAGYGDFEQSAAAGATAALTGKVLERIGIKLDVSGNAAYAVVLTAKDNSDYMADDDLRTRTYSKVRDSDGLIAGARYFFVKEAVGSQNLSYVVTKNANVEAKAQLKADSSGLSTNVKFVDAVSKIAGEKRT